MRFKADMSGIKRRCLSVLAAQHQDYLLARVLREVLPSAEGFVLDLRVEGPASGCFSSPSCVMSSTLANAPRLPFTSLTILSSALALAFAAGV